MGGGGGGGGGGEVGGSEVWMGSELWGGWMRCGWGGGWCGWVEG